MKNNIKSTQQLIDSMAFEIHETSCNDNIMTPALDDKWPDSMKPVHVIVLENQEITSCLGDKVKLVQWGNVTNTTPYITTRIVLNGKLVRIKR